MSAAPPASSTGPTPRVARDLVILNRQGVHARPSAAFVTLATKFQCDVQLEKDGELINGKSIMGLLMLAAGPGSKLRLVCEGDDAEKAATALAALVNSKFGEE